MSAENKNIKSGKRRSEKSASGGAGENNKQKTTYGTQAVHNIHDKFFKDIYSNLEITTDFLQHQLPPEVVKIIDFTSLRPEKGSFVDKKLKEYFSDLIFSCKLENQIPAELYILLEHKSCPDAYVSLQILNYMVQLWLQRIKNNEKELPVVIPLVVYHGKAKWKYKPLRELFNIPAELNFLQKYIPNVDIKVLDVAKADSEDLIKNKGTIILTFLKALQSRNAAEEIAFFIVSENINLKDNLIQTLFEQFIVYISRINSQLVLDINEEMIKLNIGEEKMQSVHSIFAPKAYEAGQIYGFELGEARGVQLGEARGMQLGEARGMQLGEARGMQLGEARGMQLGEARGEFKGASSVILNLLHNKFPYYSSSLETKIKSINDIGILTKLSIDLLQSESIAEFEKRLENQLNYKNL